MCGDWWDEQAGSPAYDTFLHGACGITPPYGDDSEALWTEIKPYQHFIDIKMPHPPDNGAGIFLHDDMPVGYTEGCVALPNAELDAVLGWLNAMTPDGASVYVADAFDLEVTPISTATNKAGPPIKVGIDPNWIAITPNGTTAYVANL